ncbi:UNVERIFIED_CONTAM: hypothetical protein FKN15_054707 [Acipenser sinensis]
MWQLRTGGAAALIYQGVMCDGIKGDVRLNLKGPMREPVIESIGYDDGYDGEYDNQTYDAYDKSYGSQTQSVPEYYEYEHGTSEEAYDSYGIKYQVSYSVEATDRVKACNSTAEITPYPVSNQLSY